MKTLIIVGAFALAMPLPAFCDEKAPAPAKVHPHRAIVIAALAKHKASHGEVKTETEPTGELLPNCFADRFYFSVPSVAPKGGQIFICSRKQYGDAIVAHYRAYPGLVGPYVFQSKDGKVVAQMNLGLKPAEAEKFEAALKELELPE